MWIADQYYGPHLLIQFSAADLGSARSNRETKAAFSSFNDLYVVIAVSSVICFQCGYEEMASGDQGNTVYLYDEPWTAPSRLA